MKKTTTLVILLLVAPFLNCFSQVDNTIPMYGSVKKTSKEKKIDDKFIKSVLKEVGSKEEGSKYFVEKGWVELYHNDLDVAMKRFNQAWLLNPKNPSAYYGFAILTELAGNNEDADRYYAMGYKLDKTKAYAKECFQDIANCLEHLRDTEGTIKAYSTLIELDSSNAFYYKKRGYFYMNEMRAEEALSDLTIAIELDPDDPLTYNNRAFLYCNQLKKPALAVQDYTAALKLDDKYISAYVNRALAYYELEKLSLAVDDLNKCITLDSKHTPFYKMKGQYLIELGQGDEGCKALKKAVDLGDAQAVQMVNEFCLTKKGDE